MLNAYNNEMQKLKGGLNILSKCLQNYFNFERGYFNFFSGPLLKKILEDSKKKINKQSTYQLHAYAGHDSTISNLLMALGVWDQQIPVYNILTLIELHESKKGKFYFKVIIK